MQLWLLLQSSDLCVFLVSPFLLLPSAFVCVRMCEPEAVASPIIISHATLAAVSLPDCSISSVNHAAQVLILKHLWVFIVLLCSDCFSLPHRHRSASSYLYQHSCCSTWLPTSVTCADLSLRYMLYWTSYYLLILQRAHTYPSHKKKETLYTCCCFRWHTVPFTYSSF